MTDLSVKNRIIALSSFFCISILLTIRSSLPFTLVFFACMGLVVFFADKILSNEKIKQYTLFAFFVFAACYQTFYQIFNRIHIHINQLMVAAALAIFLAAVFAATDRKKFPYSILCAPLICLLDTRIASAYCILLLSFSIVSIQLEKGVKQKRKNIGKKSTEDMRKLSPLTVNLISVVTSVLCFAFCIYSTIREGNAVVENSNYLLQFFKNTFGFSILLIYLLVKLIQSNLKVNVGIIFGLVMFIASAIFFTINLGWSFFSLFLISVNMFLGLVCLESEDIINEIKKDYHNHKYLFFIEFLCLLQ